MLVSSWVRSLVSVERSLWDGSTPESGPTRPALAPRKQLPQGVGLWVLPHPQ